MTKKTSQLKINHYMQKLNTISKLYNQNELLISFDRLKNNKEVDYELLYFTNKEKTEEKGLFIFSYKAFIEELKNQESKKILSQNFLNFRIYTTYEKLYQKSKIVKVSEILEILNKNDPNLSKNRILNRLFTLAYYHNWNFKKDENCIDPDYFIEIPNNFTKRPSQRFNMDIFLEIKNTKKILFFINLKQDLILVLKEYQNFSKDTLKQIVQKQLKDEFNIKKIIYKDN
ncbi:MAG: hypothetical protein ACOC16_04080 [Nanoarchaeota archaeon]